MSNVMCIITGSSRGFGLACALTLSSHYKSSLHLHLLSRTLIPSETEEILKGNGTTVVSHKIDLSDLSTLESSFTSILNSTTLPSPSLQILINNAGSLGFLSPLSSSPLPSLQSSINLNVTSSSYISSSFASLYPSSTIVNVSSLAAVTPFKTWGVYCAGKAFRDMYHRTLCLENGHLKVVNYAPGAMDTDMQGEIRGSEGCDGDLKEYFRKSKDEGTLVKPMDSAGKLVKIITKEGFLEEEGVNGSHIDYWDELKGLE